MPWPAQLQLVELDLHHVAIQRRCHPILGEQRELLRLLPAFVKHLDGLAPRRFLTVIDLTQIKHMPLDHPAPCGAAAFHNAPVAMLFAILEAGFGT